MLYVFHSGISCSQLTICVTGVLCVPLWHFAKLAWWLCTPSNQQSTNREFCPQLPQYTRNSHNDKNGIPTVLILLGELRLQFRIFADLLTICQVASDAFTGDKTRQLQPI